MHKRLLGVLVVMLLFFTAIPVGQTLAESLDVSAKVYAPLPPSGQVPLVETPDDNSTQTVQNIFITGQCYIIDPSLIVVLLRDNQTIGTGPCLPDGTFRILVGLVNGVNIITPKYITITGQSSGYGLPITLTYVQANNINETPTNNQAIKPVGLKITLNYDFITYNDTSQTEILYTVEGGTKPYVVTINWGDGTQTTAKTASNEPQSSKHQYNSILPPAALTVTAVDSNGEKVVQSRALVSFKKGLYVPAAAPILGGSKAGMSTVQKIWVGVAGFSVLLLLINHFGYVQFLNTNTSPSKSQTKTKKKGSKR